eukprot:PhF_6_TR37489/c0_g1_i1/m.55297
MSILSEKNISWGLWILNAAIIFALLFRSTPSTSSTQGGGGDEGVQTPSPLTSESSTEVSDTSTEGSSTFSDTTYILINLGGVLIFGMAVSVALGRATTGGGGKSAKSYLTIPIPVGSEVRRGSATQITRSQPLNESLINTPSPNKKGPSSPSKGKEGGGKDNSVLLTPEPPPPIKSEAVDPPAQPQQSIQPQIEAAERTVGKTDVPSRTENAHDERQQVLLLQQQSEEYHRQQVVIEQLRITLEDFQAQLVKSKEESFSLKKTVEKLEGECSQKQTTIGVLEEKVKTSTDNEARRKQKEDKTSQPGAEEAALKQKLADLDVKRNQEIEELKKQNAILAKNADQVRAELEHKIAQQQGDLAKSSETTLALQTQLNATSDQITLLQKRNTTLLAERDAEVKSLRTQYDDLVTQKTLLLQNLAQQEVASEGNHESNNNSATEELRIALQTYQTQ